MQKEKRYLWFSISAWLILQCVEKHYPWGSPAANIHTRIRFESVMFTEAEFSKKWFKRFTTLEIAKEYRDNNKRLRYAEMYSAESQGKLLCHG